MIKVHDAFEYQHLYELKIYQIAKVFNKKQITIQEINGQIVLLRTNK